MLTNLLATSAAYLVSIAMPTNLLFGYVIKDGTMLQYLEAKGEIAHAQRKLQASLRKAFPQTVVRDIGYPGGRENAARVATDGRYWFWSNDRHARHGSTPRRLNWFGVLNDSPGMGITVEINVPYVGRDDNASGFFARDSDSGIVYLLHSGRVGGGTKGVGKNSFLTWAQLRNQPLWDVIDAAGKTRSGLIVTPVDQVTSAKPTIHYIDTVREFKSAVRSGEISAPKFQRQQREFQSYFSEGRGRRIGYRASRIDYISRHGEIVDALHAWRRSQLMPRGSRVVKNVLIDMGVAIGSRLVEVFEVKPKATRSDLYSALGQLFVHGHHVDCRSVIVLNKCEILPKDIDDALKALGIERVQFSLSKKTDTVLIE